MRRQIFAPEHDAFRETVRTFLTKEVLPHYEQWEKDGIVVHGGYGYMTEYRVARAFTDGRVQTIYGGTTEIMKEIIGRSLLG
jgi:alkylation response protein AidB-like acyl-CoA dehydrogenase